MVIVDEEKNAASSISNNAYELLDCFAGGVDNLVYDISEKLARERNPAVVASGKPVPIEVEDIQTAGRMVVRALKNLVASGDIPAEVESEIDEMKNCLEES